LPFTTFGEAAAFDFEVEVRCRCRRCVRIDGAAEAFRDRRIMGARFRCTTILPHGAPCTGEPSIYIGKRDRWELTMGEHSHAMRVRQAAAPIAVRPGTFGTIVQCGEVAHFDCGHCVNGDRTGTMMIQSNKGLSCQGCWSYISERFGRGVFNCNNGKSGPFEFNGVGPRGSGVGRLGDRRFVFTYG
jgi:hypothetical protein